MSIDIRDLSDANVDLVTKLLSRRPEYGIARPSRRWLQRQDLRIKSFPNELLRPASLLKRLVVKLADHINPSAIDPRAVLCKVHSALNPWLIRRLFLAVAYEVTVYSDTLRSWKGRKDVPALSALVGRIDAIAALWTEPELYRQCYGAPPFQSHMVFVKSGCEACILGALGANARALADLRTVMTDRVERRKPRPDGRRPRRPRFLRYLESWIKHFKEESAAKCIEKSETALAELRAVRPQLTEWRNQRRAEHKDFRASGLPMYTELRRTSSGHRLSTVPADVYRKRRTRDGIPVAMVSHEDVEEQRAATNEFVDGESIYRPDSINPFGEAAFPGFGRLSTAERARHPQTPGSIDSYFDYDETQVGEEPDDHGFREDEEARSQVGGWYAERLAASRADLTPDDAQSVLSMVHPAFQTGDDGRRFTRASAVPAPLGLNREHLPTADDRGPSLSRASAWTDVTVHTETEAGSVASPTARDAPPVPRISSVYRRHESSSGGGQGTASRSSTRRSHHVRPVSSVYSSDQLTSPRSVGQRSPHGPPPSMLNRHIRRHMSQSQSRSRSRASSLPSTPGFGGGSSPYQQRSPSYQSPAEWMRMYAAEGHNPYAAGSSSRRSAAGPPSLSRSVGRSVGDDPPTPRMSGADGAWRRFDRGDEDEDEEVGDITPWVSFYRPPEK
ncbi:hypothetical protein GGR52DRAFT_232435 [Hypoxylon sp. FL1284]|nr:hypothetical protein GGR52DRAFT_232435 [Hypoxylon sp. FL1284]